MYNFLCMLVEILSETYNYIILFLQNYKIIILQYVRVCACLTHPLSVPTYLNEAEWR